MESARRPRVDADRYLNGARPAVGASERGEETCTVSALERLVHLDTAVVAVSGVSPPASASVFVAVDAEERALEPVVSDCGRVERVAEVSALSSNSVSEASDSTLELRVLHALDVERERCLVERLSVRRRRDGLSERVHYEAKRQREDDGDDERDADKDERALLSSMPFRVLLETSSS